MEGDFTERDRDQIARRGMSQAEVESQVRLLRQGLPPIRLKRSCCAGDGVVTLTPAQRTDLATRFEREVARGRATKFVVASGAGTRMFEILFPLLGGGGAPDESEGEGPDDRSGQVRRFFERLDRFAFLGDLKEALRSKGLSLDSLLAQRSYETIARFLLGPSGLNYGELPKGMVLFHRYRDGSRTALEEHLVEAEQYTRDRDCLARIHVTVSPQHEGLVREHLRSARRRFEDLLRQFSITISCQDAATDTIALDAHGKPFRTEDGSLLFRPGGHGAVLGNLDRLQADLVFITTVDNVLLKSRRDPVVEYRKVLGGFLATLQEEVFGHLEALSSDACDDRDLERVEQFARVELLIRTPPQLEGESRKAFWLKKLNRPLRVCGVVRHEGETGGAPFWVEGADSSESLQIVEMAQVDPESPGQRRVMESSTYFNPVDIVCGVRDFQDRPFNLLEFRDPDTAFITTKSWKGQGIRVLEHPGLWNGGMARWNTVFVEIPRTTFQPVKSVLDLLGDGHSVWP